MIAFFNSFISYLILVVVFAAVIVAGVIVGRKLREAKDKKDAAKAVEKQEEK